MTEKNRPQIAVGLILKNDSGEIWLGKSRRFKDKNGSGFWIVPGGHLEYGETLSECAIRESQEELGVEIEDLTFLTFRDGYFV